MFVIIFLYAIGACILSGIFSVGETKELATISEKIHGYGSVIGFFLLTFLPLIISLLSFRSNDLTIGFISLLFFVFSLVFFSLFVMADKERFAQTVISNEGLWQRLCLLCMYAPIVIISIKKLIMNWGGTMEKIQWVNCPICGNKTRDRIREDTVLKNFPLFCPKCKQETIINIEQMNMTVIKEPAAQTQSR